MLLLSSPTIENVGICHLDWVHGHPKHLKKPSSASIHRLLVVVSVEQEHRVVITSHQTVILRGDECCYGSTQSIIFLRDPSMETVNVSA